MDIALAKSREVSNKTYQLFNFFVLFALSAHAACVSVIFG